MTTYYPQLSDDFIHLTPDQHFKEAERLLWDVSDGMTSIGENDSMPEPLYRSMMDMLNQRIAMAQVHATLATFKPFDPRG